MHVLDVRTSNVEPAATLLTLRQCEAQRNGVQPLLNLNFCWGLAGFAASIDLDDGRLCPFVEHNQMSVQLDGGRRF